MAWRFFCLCGYTFWNATSSSKHFPMESTTRVMGGISNGSSFNNNFKSWLCGGRQNPKTNHGTEVWVTTNHVVRPLYSNVLESLKHDAKHFDSPPKMFPPATNNQSKKHLEILARYFPYTSCHWMAWLVLVRSSLCKVHFTLVIIYTSCNSNRGAKELSYTSIPLIHPTLKLDPL